jgi:hypothetical protein
MCAMTAVVADGRYYCKILRRDKILVQIRRLNKGTEVFVCDPVSMMATTAPDLCSRTTVLLHPDSPKL